jgi:hypothetical protein
MKIKYGYYLLYCAAITGVVLFFVKKSGSQVNIRGGKINPPQDPEVIEPTFARANNFALIPDGMNNYRSEQMTLADMERVIKKYGIKNIIRMNGDGTDTRNGVTRAKELDLANRLGVKYTFIDAHSGYVRGRGYTKSIENANKILREGNTLVHCHHGADRTGYIVATWLKQSGKMTDLNQLWEYTTKFNRWKSLIRSNDFYGSGFDKYADGFYPLDKLKLVYP